MAQALKFNGNHNDLSTDTGFQFEFTCDCCHNGFRSKFKPYVAGSVSGILNTASNIFGGIFSQASNISEDVKSATWQKDKDKAFEEATEELAPLFIQCPRCKGWVCRENCWSLKKGLCKTCAPDLGVEMAAAQASKSVEEVWAHAAMAEEDKKLGTEFWREGIQATCPKCEEPLTNNTKFCPNCGHNMKEKTNCPKCGEKLLPNAKFCAGCGEKV
jgi:hypothetical protein